jgi:hypothetical protein
MKSTYSAEIISIDEEVRKNIEGKAYFLCVVKFLEGTIINKQYFANIALSV